MRKLIYILFPVLLALAACDREAQDVTPPEIESKLVIFSFLSPEDSFAKVEVSFSRPVYTKGPKPQNTNYVPDAVVHIQNDGGFSAVLSYVDTLNAFTVSSSSYPIEAGRTYTINVSARGKIASGSCTVPKNTVAFTEITYQKRTDLNGTYNTFLYKWNDEPGTTNYYRSAIETKSWYVDFMGDTSYYTSEICTNMYTDENRNGQTLSGTCDGYSMYYGYDTAITQPMDFYLLNTDINYYEYHKRRLNYYGDDPFSEPIQQYSNINGGLGVVSAFRRTKTTILVTQ